MEYQEDYHSSALIVGPDNQVVLICDEKKPIRLWKFPGGKKESGEDPFATVIREVHEETGLTLDVDQLILVGEQRRPRYSRYYFCAFVDSFSGLVKVSEEKERTGIFKLADLEPMVDFHNSYREFYEKIKEAGLLPSEASETFQNSDIC
jgi:8-oxo-dGTP pyrophosphatase MutT (NUDIX family)